MALTGEVKKEKGGEDTFVVTITNGTFIQLKELLDFLKKQSLVKTDDPADVIKVAISLLQSAKESREIPKTE